MHRTRSIVALGATLALLAITMLVAVAPAHADPILTGVFLPPFSENHAYDAAPPATPDESIQYPTAVSSVALPNGQVVYWTGLTNLEKDPWPPAADVGRIALNSASRLLTLSESGPSWQTPTPEDGGGGDLFCSDQRILLDGSVMATGGTKWVTSPASLNDDPNDNSIPSGGTDLWGNDATRIFTPTRTGGTWTQVGSPVTDADGHVTGYTGYMHHGRWYPTLVTLPDGRLFVASGVNHLQYNTEGHNVFQTETFNPYNENGAYDPANGSWTENGESGNVSLPLFARFHLVPGSAADGSDAKVFYDGVGQMFNPYGESYDEVLWNVRKMYDPATNSWSTRASGRSAP